MTEKHTHTWEWREATMQGYGVPPLQADTRGPGRAHIPHKFLVNPPPVLVWACACGAQGFSA